MPILRILFASALATFVACGGSESPSTETEPESVGSGGEAEEVSPAPASELSVTGCNSYTYTPDDCTGSPENPSCSQNFELHGDGTGEITFDDIIVSATYEVEGSTLTLRAPRFEATYTIEDGGQVIVGDGGERYDRTDCGS